MPALIILSPLTFKVNTSSLFGIKYVGKLKYSSGVSIASIGEPAVILPSNGTCATSSFKYSLFPTISSDLYFEFVFFMYPLASSAVM